MKRIVRSDVFDKWLHALKDKTAKTLIRQRVDRLTKDNPGRGRFLGGISEMKINYGPGYRVYYKDTGKEIILILCGGDKSTQRMDIEKARKILADFGGLNL